MASFPLNEFERVFTGVKWLRGACAFRTACNASRPCLRLLHNFQRRRGVSGQARMDNHSRIAAHGKFLLLRYKLGLLDLAPVSRPSLTCVWEVTPFEIGLTARSLSVKRSSRSADALMHAMVCWIRDRLQYSNGLAFWKAEDKGEREVWLHTSTIAPRCRLANRLVQ